MISSSAGAKHSLSRADARKVTYGFAGSSPRAADEIALMMVSKRTRGATCRGTKRPDGSGNHTVDHGVGGDQ